MKSKGLYISSFIVSLLLVFSLLASMGCLTAKKFATADNLIKLTEQKNLSSVVNKELEKYRQLIGVAVDGICTNYGQNQIVLSESDSEWTEDDAKLDYNRDGHLSCREILEAFPTLLGEEVVEIDYKPAEVGVTETSTAE